MKLSRRAHAPDRHNHQRPRRKKRKRPILPQLGAPHPNQILTFPEWCELNRISERTGRRILASGAGPVVTQLSPKRIQMKMRSTMRPSRVSDNRKVRQRQINNVAWAARRLLYLVREQIAARGRVNSNLLSHIKIDCDFVSVSFIDYPGEFMDLVEWRQRQTSS